MEANKSKGEMRIKEKFDLNVWASEISQDEKVEQKTLAGQLLRFRQEFSPESTPTYTLKG